MNVKLRKRIFGQEENEYLKISSTKDFRQCPKNDCQSYFKVNADDWRNIVKEEEVFCPICRNNSPAKEYIPKAQRKAIVSGIRNLIMDYWHHGTPMSQNIAPIQSMEEFEL